MYGTNNEKSNTQKLAETLKRCGLASSVTQAHQMAGDITSTERKVQTFFDQKKKEMKDDLLMTVHPNREEFKNAKAKDIVSAQIETFRAENSKPEKIVNAEIQPQTVSPEPEMVVEAKIEPHEIELVNEPEKIETAVVEESKPEVFQPQEFTQSQDITEQASIEEIKEEPAAEKEEISHVEASSETAQVPASSQNEEPAKEAPSHPKTGNSSGIDIHNFFNFQKKGKV